MPFPKIYAVAVSRIVVQERILHIRAYTQEDAEALALQEAPDLDFTNTEKDADYRVDTAHRVLDYNGRIDIDDCDPDA
ncbi:MAG TPA: hypothetical protein VIY48_03305 [Candidatus Paceibacterota bacterium]